VVVVGNLTVGGTGKTPLVLWLGERLRERGLRVGVVSRGYGRHGAGARRVTQEDTPRRSATSRRSCRGASACRWPWLLRAGTVRLLEGECDVILSDDGLQHHALARDVEIAVVDGRRGLGNGWRLPAGPLREASSRLDRVDAVVVNGAGYTRPGALRMDVAPTRFVEVATGRTAAPSPSGASACTPWRRSAIRSGSSRCCASSESSHRRTAFATTTPVAPQTSLSATRCRC
jgi:tetraacyldisaccharide 4'-kinase